MHWGQTVCRQSMSDYSWDFSAIKRAWNNRWFQRAPATRPLSWPRSLQSVNERWSRYIGEWSRYLLIVEQFLVDAEVMRIGRRPRLDSKSRKVQALCNQRTWKVNRNSRLDLCDQLCSDLSLHLKCHSSWQVEYLIRHVLITINAWK